MRCRTGARMSSRTCPEWPQLMELAPELQFKHYTLREAQLPADALVSIEALDLDAVSICCDLTSHVFYADHSGGAGAAAPGASLWFARRESIAGRGGAAAGPPAGGSGPPRREGSFPPMPSLVVPFRGAKGKSRLGRLPKAAREALVSAM